MRFLIKNIFFIIVILLFFSAAAGIFTSKIEQTKEVSLSELARKVNNDEVKQITVQGSAVEILLKDSTKLRTRKEGEMGISQTLTIFGVNAERLETIDIQISNEKGAAFWAGVVLPFLLPFLLIAFLFWMIFRQAQKGSMQALSFTKARIRLFGAEGTSKEKVAFKDVAGLKEAKLELQEVVEFLKYPKKFLAMGARIPRGVLLLGAPGTGKTLLARAVAGEANVPFFHMSGSEFVEMFVGVGAARVRDLFEKAKKAAPAIVFVDELDAVGRQRGAGIGGGHDEREQTLNQILVEMDGFERDTNVIVMAATNRPDILDPALLRPGRFDRRVVLDLPDLKDREEILKIHVKDKPLTDDVNLRAIAERTPGFSGADLANLTNEAAILAARRNLKKVAQKELTESIEKVILGPERKSHILSQEEKKITAYHEGGHALVAAILPYVDPVQKISIVARGVAAGYTLKMPTEDKRMHARSEFINELASMIGGYAAEKIVFNEITTGASNDLEKASELARKLVKEYGMSEKLGPIVFGRKDELIFLGKEFGEERNYSEEIAAEIDKEVNRFIQNALKTAMKILKEKRALLNKIAERLIEVETIEREEFEKLIKEGTAA